MKVRYCALCTPDSGLWTAGSAYGGRLKPRGVQSRSSAARRIGSFRGGAVWSKGDEVITQSGIVFRPSVSLTTLTADGTPDTHLRSDIHTRQQPHAGSREINRAVQLLASLESRYFIRACAVPSASIKATTASTRILKPHVKRSATS